MDSLTLVLVAGNEGTSSLDERLASRFAGMYRLRFLHLDTLTEMDFKVLKARRDEPFDAMLVDMEGFIRGLYLLKDPDQVDLLITEYEILHGSSFK